MRAILTLLALAVLVVAALVYFGVIRLSGTPGSVQAPTVHADVGRVTMGHEKKTVTVPTISVEKPGQPATNQTTP
ncbi:hypothetical protein [uncultured Sphingomonas sp.]|uniref:hypothetical protein n=1 Tax=uncultured Sphingomonas sp. TaxID=158754 RepID=UPI0035C9AFD7